MIAVPPKPVRRVAIAPLLVAVEVVLIAAWPLIALIAAIASPFTGGGWRPLRVVVLGVGWTVLHLTSMLACFALWLAGGFGLRGRTAGMRRRHDGVLRWYVDGVGRLTTRIARVSVEVLDSEAAQAALSGSGRPVVVLSRHAGEGDSLLVLYGLMCRHRRRTRVVLHEALRLDPVVDVLGGWLAYRFIDPRGGDTEVEIAAMSRDLDDEGAVLIFPEGGNFSEARRRRSIDRLEQAGHDEEAGWAREMRHVSAPRPGGALAAIDAAPNADVVFVGHVGIPEGKGELWRSLRAERPVKVRMWVAPAAEVPADRDEQIDWLFGWWRTLDRWIGEEN